MGSDTCGAGIAGRGQSRAARLVSLERLPSLVLALLTIALIVIAASSLRWRMVHDSPIMLYLAYLMERHGYTPYRDLFDMNMPGTYLAYRLIGRCFGYGDLGFRTADLICLGALCGTTWLLMGRVTHRVAWCASAVFGLAYLGSGNEMSLQREYLALLPLSIATLVASSPTWRLGWRALVGGMCLGLAATIKPHMAIALPVVLAWLWRGLAVERGRNTSGRRAPAAPLLIGAGIIGFSTPVLVTAGYLLRVGAWADYVAVVRGYWPLYAALSGGHQALHGAERLVNAVSGFRGLGGHGVWLAPAAVGLFVSLYHSRLDELQRRLVGLLALLASVFAVYPILSGQFWSYHWLPLLYYVILLSALSFVEQRGEEPRRGRLLPVTVLLLAILTGLPMSRGVVNQLRGAPPSPPSEGRPDAIAAFLVSRLDPNDTVQPLDWTGGAVHGMLLARARLATPFVYDFHFYHHVSHPYTQSLRRRFIGCMAQAQPRFVIEVTDRPWPSGEDTTRSFPELNQLLRARYRVADRGQGYVIHELRRGWPGPSDGSHARPVRAGLPP